MYIVVHIKVLQLRIIHCFQHFHKSTESTLGGGSKSSCTLSKMLVLVTVPVHVTSLTNQHFCSMLLGRREGVCKKSTLCMLVMLKIITEYVRTYVCIFAL